jgi:hypothetical protein
MKAKAKAISSELDRKWGKGQLETAQEKQKRIKGRLASSTPETITNEYPFADSDDNTSKVPPKVRRSIEQKSKQIP